MKATGLIWLEIPQMNVDVFLGDSRDKAVMDVRKCPARRTCLALRVALDSFERRRLAGGDLWMVLEGFDYWIKE